MCLAGFQARRTEMLAESACRLCDERIPGCHQAESLSVKLPGILVPGDTSCSALPVRKSVSLSQSLCASAAALVHRRSFVSEGKTTAISSASADSSQRKVATSKGRKDTTRGSRQQRGTGVCSCQTNSRGWGPHLGVILLRHVSDLRPQAGEHMSKNYAGMALRTPITRCAAL